MVALQTELYLYDATGRQLGTTYTEDLASKMTISTMDLSTGVYFVAVQSDDARGIQKIIVRK